MCTQHFLTTLKKNILCILNYFHILFPKSVALCFDATTMTLTDCYEIYCIKEYYETHESIWSSEVYNNSCL